MVFPTVLRETFGLESVETFLGETDLNICFSANTQSNSLLNMFILQGNIDFFCQNRFQDLKWINSQYRVEEKIDDVKVSDEEKELATDDGDARDDKEEKT